jgi:acyl carrier protein
LQWLRSIWPAPSTASKSMKDYGANSLDIVEVVSGAMRELKVKVPRAELNTLSNIDGLVSLLHEIKSGARVAV